MSLRNKEKCSLRVKHVRKSQNGYSSSLIGHAGRKIMSLEECNQIKNYCLGCSRPECVYDKEYKESQ